MRIEALLCVQVQDELIVESQRSLDIRDSHAFIDAL